MADIDMDPHLKSSTEMKLETARQKKQTGDQAFNKADYKAALFSYHESLMYLLGLDKNALQSIGIGSSAPPQKDKDGKELKEKTEVDELVEKVYSNMAACHLLNKNWKRLLDTAEKVLAKNENNYKNMYRKGKALGELGFYEKAVKILEEVKEKSPKDAPACDLELNRLRALDKEREKANNQKLKGFLNRKEFSKATDEDRPRGVAPPPPASIEEVS